MILKPARLLLALIAIACAPAFAQTVATVNGKAIPSSRLDAMVKQVTTQGKQPDSPQLRDAVKKDLIAREVMVQEADKQGYSNKPEVKQALENTRQSIVINAMLADYAAALGLPVLLLAFLLASLLKVAQGSSTVAIITSASVIAGIYAGGDPSLLPHPVYAALAAEADEADRHDRVRGQRDAGAIGCAERGSASRTRCSAPVRS